MKNNVDVKLRPMIHAYSEIRTIVPVMQGIYHKKTLHKNFFVKCMNSSKLQHSDSIENGTPVTPVQVVLPNFIKMYPITKKGFDGWLHKTSMCP